uniref:Uncharacterized protein n=1 Tax=Oryza glumipatula TaxID=40148 RepID=A0A0E0B0I1_9ORYZ
MVSERVKGTVKWFDATAAMEATAATAGEEAAVCATCVVRRATRPGTAPRTSTTAWEVYNGRWPHQTWPTSTAAAAAARSFPPDLHYVRVNEPRLSVVHGAGVVVTALPENTPSYNCSLQTQIDDHPQLLGQPNAREGERGITTKGAGLSAAYLAVLVYEGNMMTFRAGWFPKLEKLYLADMEHLSVIERESSTMPIINYVKLIGLKSMMTVPAGFQYLTSLEEVVVEDMPEEFKRRWQGQDHVYIQHIPTSQHIICTDATPVQK